MGDYRKMAGTAAVFISTSFDKASPVDREGLVWSARELHLEDLPKERRVMPTLASVLALEGLESYDPPKNGDVREVSAMRAEFIYFEKILGWVQITHDAVN